MLNDSEELKPIVVDRELTTTEYALAKWMLENGGESSEKHLDQLERARVCALCSCGCASIDFGIGGASRPYGPLTVLGDYLYYNEAGDCLANVFIFAVGETLAGLEVCSFDDAENDVFPTISGLRLWDKK